MTQGSKIRFLDLGLVDDLLDGRRVLAQLLGESVVRNPTG